MTKPDTTASLVILRAILAAATPEQLRRLYQDIRDSDKGTA